MKRKAAMLLALGALIAAPSTARAPEGKPFEVGKPFPLLVLASLEDGRPMSLEQFRGRPLVLHVFASW